MPKRLGVGFIPLTYERYKFATENALCDFEKVSTVTYFPLVLFLIFFDFSDFCSTLSTFLI